MTSNFFGYGDNGRPGLLDHLFGPDPEYWARKLSRVEPDPTASWLSLALLAWREPDLSESTFWALAAQLGLLRDVVGPPEVIFPPPTRRALGLPPRVNLPVKFIEAACREATVGHNQFSSSDAGVAESTLQGWRASPAWDPVVSVAARHRSELARAPSLLEGAGALPLWPSKVELLGISVEIPVTATPSLTSPNPTSTDHAQRPAA